MITDRDSSESISEVFSDYLLFVLYYEDKLIDVRHEMFHIVLEKGLSGNFYHDFRYGIGYRTQSSTFSCSKDDSFHRTYLIQ